MLILLVVFICALSLGGKSRKGGNRMEVATKVLVVHCAAGLQKPVREIITQYEAESGVEVVLNLAGSGVLETQMKTSGGDLYIPADESYVLKAKDEGFIEDTRPLVILEAVIVVQKGNPKGIKSLDSLKAEGLRLSVADSTAAIGHYIKNKLTDSGDWAEISPQVIVTKPTVNNVVEDVANKTVDAALAWDAVADLYEVDIVRLPLFQVDRRVASAGVITSGDREEAQLLMNYLASSETAKNIFNRLGYQIAQAATNEAKVGGGDDE